MTGRRRVGRSCLVAIAVGASLAGGRVTAQGAQVPAGSQEEADTQGSAEATALQDQVNAANNPLASLGSVALQNYYFPKLNGVPDASANTFFLRLVMPFWRIIPRATLPISVVPAPNPDTSVASVTGLGDFNVFATFVLTKPESKATFGIGPIYTAPTATSDLLGNGKHEVGVAALTVWTKGVLLIGSLVNWQIGVGGDSARPKTQFMAVQPFVMFQLGKGYYLRTAPIWFFNFEEPEYNVPFSVGLGKVIPTEKIIFNLFLEPQFGVAVRGIGQPNVQIFAGINLQFHMPKGKKGQNKNATAARLVDQLAQDQDLRAQLQR